MRAPARSGVRGMLAVPVLVVVLGAAGCGTGSVVGSASSWPTGTADLDAAPAPSASPATGAPLDATPDGTADGTADPSGDPTAGAGSGAPSVPGPVGAQPAPVPADLEPVRIAVPSAGVDSAVVDLGIAPDGTIEVPGDPDEVGWLETTPAPGQQGPAVLAGHVDSSAGPAVFADLSGLRPGEAIEVTRRDGSTADFTVDGVRTYPQDDFPTAEVYGPVPGPALRLITCGGAYVRSEGGYQDNVVVYAS